MNPDSKSPDVPTIGAASDDEFIRALHRAERAALPPEPKMRELAERLGPMMATKRSAGVAAWRWVTVIATAGVLVAGAASYRRHVDAREGGPPASVEPHSVPEIVAPAASPPPAAREEAHEVAAPVVSVDALPPAAPSPPLPRPRVLAAAPACAGELELVERADGMLRAEDPQGALELALEHAARCPNGEFAQERERVAIEALARLGRIREVRARAASFERRFPSSPHVWRIRSLAERDSE